MIKRVILNHLSGFLDRPLHYRWSLIGVGVLSALGMVAATAVTTEDIQPPGGVQPVVEQLDILARAPVQQGSEAFLLEERIERGDTFGKLLSRLGIQDEEARRFILQDPSLNPLHRQMVPGRVVSAYTSASGELISLHFPMTGGNTVTVVERVDGRLQAREQTLSYETHVAIKSGQISYSLFQATDMAGIPDSIATQMAEIFSADIDFHRDLRKGDTFSLVYEMDYYRGQPARTGRILSAEFVNAGKVYQAFYYEQDGKGSYYSADGSSRKKAFLRSPLEFSRVTSGFSLRFHPILKQWRAHKGVDYGAPTGTRIRATGDGVVEFIGKQGGYGNLVILSHAGHYQTAYAHMSGFASGLKKGSRVAQGDLVGYVGQTGWATGPHLHYEFRVKGTAIDPLSVAIPTAQPLSGQHKLSFKTRTQDQLAMLEMLKGVAPGSFE